MIENKMFKLTEISNVTFIIYSTGVVSGTTHKPSTTGYYYHLDAI
jgi:hypothetical protein